MSLTAGFCTSVLVLLMLVAGRPPGHRGRALAPRARTEVSTVAPFGQGRSRRADGTAGHNPAMKRRRGSSSRVGRVTGRHRNGSSEGPVAHADRMLTAIGRAIRVRSGRPPSPGLDRRIGTAVILAASATVVVGPLAGLVAVATVFGRPALRVRSERRRRDAELIDSVPDVIDLFRLAVASGLNIRLAVVAVAAHSSGPLGVQLDHVVHRCRRGDRLGDALRDLEPLGEPVRPLLDALLASERYGTPLLPALDRVADGCRQSRRRRHEERARRVPVTLLFPLVLCTLPALVLLTIVPVVVRSWPSLTP